MQSLTAQFEGTQDIVEKEGYAIVPKLLEASTLDALDVLTRDTNYGERNLLSVPQIRKLAASDVVRSAVVPILGGKCFAVRGILFDKTELANWKVPWHQDRVIAVKEPIEVSGFRLWSVKAGVHHVQPSAEIMSGMLAIRLHLDDCGEENGPLRVLPGSQSAGFLSAEQIESWKAKRPRTCTVHRGDAILMRPLLLHASSPCSVVHRRRVIHIEFTADDLPGGLEWQDRVC